MTGSFQLLPMYVGVIVINWIKSGVCPFSFRTHYLISSEGQSLYHVGSSDRLIQYANVCWVIMIHWIKAWCVYLCLPSKPKFDSRFFELVGSSDTVIHCPTVCWVIVIHWIKAWHVSVCLPSETYDSISSQAESLSL